jgi:hypothetical protein
MYQQQIEKLQRLHADLDRRITALEKTGCYDDVQLVDLKKQRLLLKDQLFRLRKNQWEHDYDRHGFDDE